MAALTGTKSYIFEQNDAFPSCHASTLTHLSGGGLLAAWFGGTCEGDPDVDIWIARRHKGIWSRPVKAAEEEGLPHWNPVLFTAEDGTVYLFYKVGHTFSEWYTRVIISRDEGQTWSQPRELVQGDRGGRGPVRNKPIILQNGAWLAPASLEQEAWEAFTDVSLNLGETWTSSSIIRAGVTREPGKGVIQPTLWESKPNHVHMLLRSTEGFIYRSDSSDGGNSWSEA